MLRAVMRKKELKVIMMRLKTITMSSPRASTPSWKGAG
jgi:hypothetical protein